MAADLVKLNANQQKSGLLKLKQEAAKSNKNNDYFDRTLADKETECGYFL